MGEMNVIDASNSFFTDNTRPSLYYIGHVCDDPDWALGTDSHPELCEIIYVAGGEGEFIINNESYSARRGDLFIINQNVPHAEKSSVKNPMETYFCGITGLHIRGLSKNCILAGDICPHVPAGKYQYKIESFLTDIFQECQGQVLGYELICEGLLTSLILLIHRVVSTTKEAPGTPLSEKIREYIDANYVKNLSLSSIARDLYISRDYVSHSFKNDVGISPINYLINLRIDQAKKLLLYTDKPLTEIARSVGYENPSHFTQTFKKLTGTSPRQFRSDMKKK